MHDANVKKKKDTCKNISMPFSNILYRHNYIEKKKRKSLTKEGVNTSCCTLSLFKVLDFLLLDIN